MAIYRAKEIKTSCCYKKSPDSTTVAFDSGVCAVQGNGDYIWRSFLQYDLSGIPENASILSAKLHFYCCKHNDNTKSGTTNIARVTSEWNEETCCWNNMPTWDGTYLTENVYPPDVNTWGEWDVTELVKEWAYGICPNYGLHIVNNNEGSNRMDWQIRNRYHHLNYGTEYLATYIEIEYGDDEFYKVRKSTMTEIADEVRNLADSVSKMTPYEIAKTLKGVSVVIKDALNWKTHETKFKTEAGASYDISALSDAKEFMFVIPVSDDGSLNMTILVDKDSLNSDTEQYFRSGYYYTNSNYCLVQVRMQNMKMCPMVYINGAAKYNYYATLKYR